MTPDDYRRLVAAGMTPDQIALVMEIMSREADERAAETEAKRAAKRAGNAERQRRHRLSRVTECDASVTERDAPRPDKESSPTPPKEINPSPRVPPSEAVITAPTPRSELETVLDEQRAQAVIDHRQRLRKPLTSHAAKLLAGKLARTADPNAAADTMVANGWQGFEPDWLDRRASNGPRAGPVAGKPMNARDLSQALLREMEANDEHSQAHSGRRQPALVAIPGR